jgi:membrane protein
MQWDPIRRLKELERAIWSPRHHLARPAWKPYAIRAARLAIVLFRDFWSGGLTLWTMSLVYTTLLSMVPLLALSFSVLKAFGVHSRIEPMLQDLLAPLGEQGHEITGRLVEFIDHMNVGVLGSVGLALLIYTVVSLMEKIEESFNSIWHVTQLRSLGERFSRYLSVLLVGPLLIFSAVGITAAAMNSEVVREILSIAPLGSVVLAIGKLMPYLLVIAAFTFFYMFIPNASVRFAPALVAGIAGGVLWQSAGWAFALFVASSTRYAAIYSSFAILVLFLIWLYVSWLILLFGASISFYLQHPEYLYASPGEPRLSNRMRERLALAIMSYIASNFVSGRPAWTLQQLTERLGIPMHSVNVVLDALEANGLLIKSDDNPPAYLPARDLADVSVAELLTTVRKCGEDRFLDPDSLAIPATADEVVKRMEKAIASSLANVSVKSLAEGSHALLQTGGLTEVSMSDRLGRVGGVVQEADPARKAS